MPTKESEYKARAVGSIPTTPIKLYLLNYKI